MMIEPQFTPGPWVVNPLIAQVDCQKISEQGGLLPVCQLLWPTDERSEAETEANARLIALAPELYAQLRQLAVSLSSDDPRRTRAWNVLRKAVGQ